MKQKRKMALLLCCLMALSVVMMTACAGDGEPTGAPPVSGWRGRPNADQVTVDVNAGDTSTLLAGTARAGSRTPSFRHDYVRDNRTWWWPSPGSEEFSIVYWGAGEYVFWEVAVSGNHRVEMVLVYHAASWEGGSGNVTITREDGSEFQSFDFQIEPTGGDDWARIRFPTDTRFRWPSGTYRVTITAGSDVDRSLMSLRFLSFQRVG